MLYTFLVLVIAGLITFLAYKAKFNNMDTSTGKVPMDLLKLVAVFVGSLILLGLQPYTVQRVDAGNVGIAFHMTGDNRGVSNYEYASGYVPYNTWFVKLYEFPTYQRHVEYDEQTVITRGGLTCKVTPSFNYKLKSGDVGDMFVNLRLPIEKVEQQWLKNAVAGTINDVANKWAVDSIFNHRQEFEGNVLSDINKKVTRWFELSQMRTNIEPPPSLGSSIIAKTNNLQKIQIAENDKRVQRVEGEAREIKAKADSTVAVTEAAGEAKAIEKKQLTLTPLYIQYMYATTWKGEYPNTLVIGGGQQTPIMFNMGK